jgi:hypothetical protein
VDAEEDNEQFVISDSECDSSIESMISESEGDVQGNDNFYNDDNLLPPPIQVPEGAPPSAPNINDGPQRSTRKRKPIDRFVPGAKNIRDSCPNYVWKSGADGSLEKLDLWTFRRSFTKMDKLNSETNVISLFELAVWWEHCTSLGQSHSSCVWMWSLYVLQTRLQCLWHGQFLSL